jgi:uncharacterized membrane protein
MPDGQLPPEFSKTARTQTLPPDFFSPNPQTAEPPPGLFKMLRNRLFAGLLIVIPAVISLLVALYIYDTLTEWAVELVKLMPWTKDMPLNGFWFAHSIRVISLLIMLAALIFIGQLAKMALGKKLISLAQTILMKVPLISSIYSTTQQIGDALWSSKGGMFRQVVLFEFPKKGIWSVGFLTNEYKDGFEIKDKLGGEELISVFMPTTPNPTSGFLMLIPKNKCKLLDMEVAEAMRFIISGGAVLPHEGGKPNSNPPPK